MPTPLQRLIANYRRTHPGETYDSMAARGGLPKSTLHAIATRELGRQTPTVDTISALARALQMPERRIREAVAQSAGYEHGGARHENPEIQLLIDTVRGLDPERLEAVLRRAELLHREMLEEQAAKRRRPRRPTKGDT